jgi:hypothetical protein
VPWRSFKSTFAIEGFAFAALFAATGLGIVLAQIVTSRPIAGFGVLLATRLAAWILFSVTLLMVLLALAGALRAPMFASLMFIFNTSFLVVIAHAASLLIDPHREIAALRPRPMAPCADHLLAIGAA